MTTAHHDGDDSGVWVDPLDTSDERRRGVLIGVHFYRRRFKIRYDQGRPTQLRWPRFTTKLDCSGLVASILKKLKVLPRVDWSRTNTWFQMGLGVEVELRRARPGDVVFYRSPSHEALYLGTRAQLEKLFGKGKIPREILDVIDGEPLSTRWVLSFGHYPMGIYPVDYRGDRFMVRDLIGGHRSP